MSQTELDVSHGYAFSQVTKQKSFLLGLSFTYLDAGGEGCSIPNRVYTKIWHYFEVKPLEMNIISQHFNPGQARQGLGCLQCQNQLQFLQKTGGQSQGCSLNALISGQQSEEAIPEWGFEHLKSRPDRAWEHKWRPDKAWEHKLTKIVWNLFMDAHKSMSWNYPCSSFHLCETGILYHTYVGLLYPILTLTVVVV